MKRGAPSASVDDLLAGLPATLDDLLAHPESLRPEVVEALLERTDTLRRRDPQGTLDMAEAASRLAAKLPAFFPRDVRFRLRAKSFELWGSLQRALGESTRAEAGYLAALELSSQVDGLEPERMSALLGRHALLAGDRGDFESLSRCVEAGLEVAREVDPSQPLAAIRPLLEGVMGEERSVLPVMWATLALVANVSAVPEGGGPETVGEVTTEAFLGDEGIEIFVRREAPAWGRLPWKISAQILLYSQDVARITLVRQVPSTSEPDGWAVDDHVAWKVYATEEAAAADES